MEKMCPMVSINNVLEDEDEFLQGLVCAEEMCAWRCEDKQACALKVIANKSKK